jgi:hemolysin III
MSESAARSAAPAWPRERWEELANAITHGFGTALAVAALVLMVVFASLRGTARHIVGASLFGASMVLLYLMSTLYHAFRGRRVKLVFRVLDHASIFLLIAGTYTPFCLATLHGPWGWTLFGLIWGLAVVGITLKSILLSLAEHLLSRRLWEGISLAIYLMMGWLVVIAIVPLWKAMPAAGLLWLFGGGLCYTLGAIFYGWQRLPFHHAFWHAAVVAGTACHFACVLGYVIPGRG